MASSLGVAGGQVSDKYGQKGPPGGTDFAEKAMKKLYEEAEKLLVKNEQAAT